MGGLAATLLVPLSPTLILSIAALKLLDKGRGIIITMYAYLPPPIPSTQWSIWRIIVFKNLFILLILVSDII